MGRIDGQPLIYASLGSLVNGLDHVYKHILGAVGALKNVQVVLSVGKNIDPENLGRIPSSTIAVRSAPQIELLKRAALCITHAGFSVVPKPLQAWLLTNVFPTRLIDRMLAKQFELASISR